MNKPITILYSLSLIVAFFIASANGQPPELVVQTGHSRGILAFSSSDRYIVSGSGSSITIWDMHTGKELRTVTGDAWGMTSITFSPNEQLFASSGWQHLSLWEVPTGKELRSFGLPSISYKSVAFSPDGRFLAAGEAGGNITLWDLYAIAPIILRTLKNSLHTSTHDLAFSPNGKFLASGSDFGVTIWDVSEGKTLHTFQLPSASHSVSFSPDGHRIAVGGVYTAVVKLLDVRTGKELRSFPEHGAERFDLIPNPPPMCHAAFSPEGSLLVEYYNDEKLSLLDAQTGETLRTFSGSFPAVFNSDGQFLAANSKGGIVVWDTRTGNIIRKFEGYANRVDNVAFQHNSSVIAHGADALNRKVIQRWDLRTGKVRNTVMGKLDGWAPVALSLDARYLAKGYEDGVITIWDVEAEKELQRFTGHSAAVYELAFNPEGQILVSSARERIDSENWGGVVKLWNVHTGKNVYTLKEHPDDTSPLVFSPDGRFLASSKIHSEDESMTLFLWDVRTGELHRTFTKDSATHIYSIAFSPDGKIIAVGDWGTATLWEIRTGKEIRTIPGKFGAVNALAFSPDSYFFAGGGSHHTLELWDIQGDAHAPFRGHSGWIGSAVFSPDGRFLLSSSDDNQIKLWDINSSEEIAALISIGTTDDYVIATPDYYYTASKEALKGVAFRLGNTLYPFEQFDLKFNRPDIVLERIGCAPQELIDAYRKAYEKRLKKMNFNEEMLGDDFHLPETKLLDDDLPLFTVEKQLTFNVNISDSKYLLDRLNVYVNNVSVYGTAGINLRDRNTSEHEQTIALELNNGRNKIQVSALNQKGAESLSETFEIEYTGTPAQPDLYVVAVGVSDYAGDTYDLTYADRDAADIVAFFEEHSQNFGVVHVKKFLNIEARKESILAVKDWLRRSKVDDQVVLFFSGHGVLDKKLDYYFATPDIDFRHPAKRGLPYEAIEGLLDEIPARKKLLFVDTCHSGEVDKEDIGIPGDTELKEEAVTGKADVEKGVVRSHSFRGLERLPEDRLGLQNSFELLRELFADLRRGSGVIVISSASGREFAFESRTWGNGVFTYAVLEGLQGKADLNNDREIRVSELRDYAMMKVQQLTKNRQTPTARRENLEFDFRVY